VAEESAGNSGYAAPPPSDDRRKRAHASEETEPGMVFVERKISQEKLDSLRAFLKGATSDDIAMIRKMYGENIEVLKLIGLYLDGEA